MYEFIQMIISRHAIRRFEDRQIDEEALAQILEAGLYAPSAGNNQRSRIVVCQDKAINLELGRLSRWMQYKDGDPAKIAKSISADQPSIQDDLSLMDGFYGAPTVLTIFALDRRYCQQDAAIVAQNMQLAAHALGIGSCYIGRTDEVFATEYGQGLIKSWGIEEDLKPVCNLVLGYRKGPAPGPKPRREGRVLRV